MLFRSVHFGELGGVFGFGREVDPFMRIALDVIEFLVASLVLNATSALGADGVALGVIEIRDRGVRPRRGWVTQQGNETAAHDVGFLRQAAQVGERAEQIDQADRPVTHRASACALGQTTHPFRHADHERHTGAGAPAGELLPVLLLAEMPAVITPEHDDGVVALRTLFQRIKHAPEHGIGEMNGGEESLNAFLPLTLFLDVLEVAPSDAVPIHL